jgi:hypothetical protein
MRKLNQLQKEMIMKNFKMGATLIKWVEKVGDENANLEDDIQLAKDIIQEKQ